MIFVLNSSYLKKKLGLLQIFDLTINIIAKCFLPNRENPKNCLASYWFMQEISYFYELKWLHL